MKKRQKDFLIFFGIFILAILMYSNWLTMHYASDTYNIMNVGYETYATNWSLKDGRLIMYLITMICAKLNVSIEIYVIGTLLGALLISAGCVIKLKNTILKNGESNLKKEILITIASFFTIFNFMYIENMYFVEAIVMALSLLAFIYSADFIVNNKGIKNKSIALILAIIGVIAYQGTAGFLIIVTFVFSLLKNKVELKDSKENIKTNIKTNIKQILIDVFVAGVCALIGICINMLIVNVIGDITGKLQTRVGSIANIFTNLQYIISNFSDILKDNIGLFPTNLLYIFLSVILICSLAYDIKTKSKNFLTIKEISIIIVSIICGFVVSLGTLSSFYTGRLHFSIGSMLGFVLICLIMENEDEIFRKIFALILIIYSFITIYNCIIVTYEHKLVNKYEQEEVQTIENYIKDYESRANTRVKNIAIYTIKGQAEKTYFENISRKSVVTYNAVRCDWAAAGVINFYTKRNLETVNLTKDLLTEYLEQENEDGYGIVDNALVIECYMY